jgi:hypothetical protein
MDHGLFTAPTQRESAKSTSNPFPGPGGKWLISNGGGRRPVRVAQRAGTVLGKSRQPDYDRPLYRDSRFVRCGQTARAVKRADSRTLPHTVDVDLSPDGKRFAVFPKRESTSEQKASVHVTVLLNFFDELRRRVPAGNKQDST